MTISNDDLAKLIQALVGLIGALTVAITLWNNERINRLHARLSKQSDRIDTIANSSQDCTDQPSPGDQHKAQ